MEDGDFRQLRQAFSGADAVVFSHGKFVVQTSVGSWLDGTGLRGANPSAYEASSVPAADLPVNEQECAWKEAAGAEFKATSRR